MAWVATSSKVGNTTSSKVGSTVHTMVGTVNEYRLLNSNFAETTLVNTHARKQMKVKEPSGEGEAKVNMMLFELEKWYAVSQLIIIQGSHHQT